MENKKILFVCLGNICRSPSAEAVFRSQAAKEGLLGKLEGWFSLGPPSCCVSRVQ